MTPPSVAKRLVLPKDALPLAVKVAPIPVETRAVSFPNDSAPLTVAVPVTVNVPAPTIDNASSLCRLWIVAFPLYVTVISLSKTSMTTSSPGTGETLPIQFSAVLH